MNLFKNPRTAALLTGGHLFPIITTGPERPGAAYPGDDINGMDKAEA